MFADDTIIYSSGQSISEIQSKLQMAIDSAIPWYESNRLAVNTEKSSVMLIGKKTQIWDNNLNFYINNVQVNETNCTKYLGLFIDKTLSWDMQCDKLCRHISGKIAVLRRIRSFTKPSIMKLIYDRTIQPIIDYGCSVWYNTTYKNVEKLQKSKIMLPESSLGNSTILMFVVSHSYVHQNGWRYQRDVNSLRLCWCLRL